MAQHKLIIIGSGPAGLTAAIYAARAELAPVVLGGTAFGGQLMLTSAVGNFPGFVEDVKGPELMQRMMEQAKRFGAEIILENVISADFRQKPFRVKTATQEFFGEAVIIATGASVKWLGLPAEQRLRGRGVSSCATCDGFFFKGKKVVVVGGGDTALEEAIYLTKYASEITVIHRRDTLAASKIMQNRAQGDPKIKFIWDSVAEDILGEQQVQAVKIRNTKTGESSEISAAGVFVAIGHKPNTEFLKDSGISLDEKGYILSSGRSQTNIPGVFVAGDVSDYIYRQAVTAAGAGCRAALDAERWLASQKSGN